MTAFSRLYRTFTTKQIPAKAKVTPVIRLIRLPASGSLDRQTDT
jgi:hypothetical protein